MKAAKGKNPATCAELIRKYSHARVKFAEPVSFMESTTGKREINRNDVIESMVKQYG